jgi:hypothetical protein
MHSCNAVISRFADISNDAVSGERYDRDERLLLSLKTTPGTRCHLDPQDDRLSGRVPRFCHALNQIMGLRALICLGPPSYQRLATTNNAFKDDQDVRKHDYRQF